MPKNIILCSDGTGNSGAKAVGTNVWRLYEALDRAPPSGLDQVAFYDDGVGTDSLKLPRLLGGAFGWGITRNLQELYGFLLREYSPRDSVFLFGFSRGAFTVRTLANILRHCGLPNKGNRSPAELDQIAWEAVEAYKNRTRQSPFPVYNWIWKFTNPTLFRDKYTSVNIPIKMVGVWDTVDAVGLPFDELTDAFSWLIRLRLRDRLVRGAKGRMHPAIEIKDDFNPLIENVYHVISIDDERQTFHPVMWTELPGQKTLWGKAPTVEQVWFAGVHSNVGGGYPQEGMSLISLVWMIEHAHNLGLHFNSLVGDYQRDADVHSKLYDSRAGVGVFYRYFPRPLAEICQQAGIAKPQIHASALDRVARQTDDYVPFEIPENYTIVGKAALFNGEHDAARRVADLEVTKDLVCFGRFQYWALIWSCLLLAGFCIFLAPASPTPDLSQWASAADRCLYMLEKPLLDLAQWLIPAYFEPWLNTLRYHPRVTAAFVFFFGLLWRWAAKLDQEIETHSVFAWKRSLMRDNLTRPKIPSFTGFIAAFVLGAALFWSTRQFGQSGDTVKSFFFFFFKDAPAEIPMTPPNSDSKSQPQKSEPRLPLLLSLIRFLRTSLRLKNFWTWWNWHVTPKATLAAALAGAVYLLGYVFSSWLGPAYIVAEPQRTERPVIEPGAEPVAEPARERLDGQRAFAPSSTAIRFTFHTRDALLDTGYSVQQGEWHEVKVRILEGWKDASLLATPEGVPQPSRLMTVFGGYRRVPSQPWFRLLGSIGADGDEIIPIGEGTRFQAGHSGRLYLFVNDMPGRYGNNRGTAEVTLRNLTREISEHLNQPKKPSEAK